MIFISKMMTMNCNSEEEDNITGKKMMKSKSTNRDILILSSAGAS